MSDLSIKDLIIAQGDAINEWKKRHDADLNALAGEVAELKLGAQRPAFGTGAPAKSTAPVWYDTKTKQPIPVLGPTDSLTAMVERRSDEPNVPIGRVLRGIALGGRADDARELAEERKALGMYDDTAGGYTISGRLAAQWIDYLRAAMVLTRAGCTVLPMDSASLSVARLDSDPVAYWHRENAALTEGEPTFGQVSLQSKTVTILIKLGLESAQDSANLEQILLQSSTAAMAAAIDSAGLQGSSTNAAAAPVGLLNASGINAISSVGAPTTWGWLIDGMYELMADNVPFERIGALVAHPKVWQKMRKLATGITNDNTPLPAPPEVQAIPKLWTTAAPFTGGNTCQAVIGDWADLLMGVRQQINVRILDQAFFGSNLQLALVAYARCDFVPARAASFCSMPGITV